jgi:hypothetical protein
MTDTQQEKPKQNLIPSSFYQAFLAGGAASGLAIAFGTPVEYGPRIFLAGSCFSLYLSWRDSRYQTAPRKKPKGRQIPLNSLSGQRKINMELVMSQGGYITRESYLDGFKRWLSGGPKPVARQVETVNRPKELDEFVFYSQGLQLREKHVKLFLTSAWRNRQYGKGLSVRRWVRNQSQRPAWYQELSPTWYYAMIDLLYKAGDYTGWQLVVRYHNGWLSLVDGNIRLTLSVLKWYEYETRK